MPYRVLNLMRRQGAKLVLRRDAEKLGVSGRHLGRAMAELVRLGHLDPIGRGAWLRVSEGIAPLSRDLAWSHPGLRDPEVQIASHLVSPRARDLFALAFHYGPARLRRRLAALETASEISSGAAAHVRRILSNIEKGYAAGARLA